MRSVSEGRDRHDSGGGSRRSPRPRITTWSHRVIEKATSRPHPCLAKRVNVPFPFSSPRECGLCRLRRGPIRCCLLTVMHSRERLRQCEAVAVRQLEEAALGSTRRSRFLNARTNASCARSSASVASFTSAAAIAVISRKYRRTSSSRASADPVCRSCESPVCRLTARPKEGRSDQASVRFTLDRGGYAPSASTNLIRQGTHQGWSHVHHRRACSSDSALSILR